MDKTQQTHQRRFAGVPRIYGNNAYQRFQQAHICVIGLGGVGSWVVEGLVRSGIGHMTLIDMDHVAESNINRQCQATDHTIGQAKTQALAERIASINPQCKVNCIDRFIDADNEAELLNPSTNAVAPAYHWVIDCIDSFRTKASLIAYCRRNKIKLLTVGGAGGMIDPTRIRIVDLSKTLQDPLLAKTRKLLRQNYAFPTNPARRFGIPCVFSEESLLYPDGQGEVSFIKSSGQKSGLNCAGGFGSSVCVTAPMGFFAAGFVLKKLAL